VRYHLPILPTGHFRLKPVIVVFEQLILTVWATVNISFLARKPSWVNISDMSGIFFWCSNPLGKMKLPNAAEHLVGLPFLFIVSKSHPWSVHLPLLECPGQELRPC
jgi:hypothetical protein